MTLTWVQGWGECSSENGRFLSAGIASVGQFNKKEDPLVAIGPRSFIGNTELVASTQ